MSLERELEQASGAEVYLAEPMSRHTTFRVGGPADYYVTPKDTEGLREVISLCRAEGLPYLIIGNGSNLLCSDSGYRGAVVDLTRAMNSIQAEGDCALRACAGASLSAVSRLAAQRGLTGLEFAAGIPGSVGGAVVMNAGAYGGEIRQAAEQIQVMTIAGDLLWLTPEMLDLSYRHSLVREKGYIVTEVLFRLNEGVPEQIQDRMDELMTRRRDRQPLDWPSAGSTFKRPAGHYAAALIEEAGLKGFTVGGAQVSEKHAGFVINAGGATAQDILSLCRQVQERVFANSGVALELEIIPVGDF